MTIKDKLKQYIFIKEELKDLEQRIENDRIKLKELEQSMVTDSVACGKKGKKPIRTLKVTGFPSNEYSKRKTIITGRVAARERLITKLEGMQEEVEDYINSIDDAVIRMAIRHRYVDCLPWEQVANKVKGNTEDSIRKRVSRYLDASE